MFVNHLFNSILSFIYFSVRQNCEKFRIVNKINRFGGFYRFILWCEQGNGVNLSRPGSLQFVKTEKERWEFLGVDAEKLVIREYHWKMKPKNGSQPES
ncbi:MAG: hypothetical protein D4R67_12280 [Bacteroidetes bacterium]|nr:MAG: hypothetical protein D4R67_12280 [Bacteroidota bacterium]